jgi:carboxypeptidase-like protein
MTFYSISNVYSLTIKTPLITKDFHSSLNPIYYIDGTVIDSSVHQVIPGVSIILNHSSRSVMTDLSGHFILPLPYNPKIKKFSITASSIGYHTKKIKIDNLNQIFTYSLTIYLDQIKIDSNQIITICCKE